MTVDALVRLALQLYAKELLGRKGSLWWNDRDAQIYLGDEPLDQDEAIASFFLNQGYVAALCYDTKDGGMRPQRIATEIVQRQLLSLAREFHRDPVKDYLDGLPEWDGTDRVPDLVETLHLKNPRPIYISYFRCTLRAAVARVYDRGCKVDTVPILQDPDGGKKKSTFWLRLAGKEFFTDAKIDTHNKDSWALLDRHWIFELSEVGAITGARSREDLLAFISRAVDEYRAPYARASKPHPRSQIFVGSTNRREFLDDEGGNRRFWIIPDVGSIDLDRVSALRNLLWSQAVAEYRAGKQWWLSDEDEAVNAELLQEHVHEDVGGELVAAFVATREEVTVSEIVTRGQEGLQAPIFKSIGGQRAVARILRALGWSRAEEMRGGLRAKRWRRGPNAAPRKTTMQAATLLRTETTPSN